MSKEYILPNISQAKSRNNHQTNVNYNYQLPEEAVGLGTHKKYIIQTYGCQANVRDSETIAGLLEQMGFSATETVDDADLILLNTCAIRENAENRVFGEIGNLKHLKVKNPDLVLGVCGCMAQEEVVVNKILQSYPQVDLVFGTHNIYRLPTLLHQTMFTKEKTVEVFSQQGEIYENLPEKRFGDHKAWVNIMYGCDKFCTYCVVPFTRGKERSRYLADIVEEVTALKQQGFKEVTLLGQNVNAYGKDLAMQQGFAELLNAVAKTNIERIRFTTSHPWDFSDAMIETIANNPNIMPALHLPVQSGNNEILKIMGRRYTIEEYKNIFDKLKTAIPDITFSTDIIVGFPNETDSQFQDTLDLYDYCQFDFAFTFIYSPRSNTPAAKFDDNVTMEVKKQRLAQLNQKVGHYAYQKNQGYVSQIVEVLVDGPSKKDKNVFSGYSKHQKLVNFKSASAKPGEIVLVKITGFKTWFLIGEQVASSIESQA